MVQDSIKTRETRLSKNKSEEKEGEHPIDHSFRGDYVVGTQDNKISVIVVLDMLEDW